MNNNLKLKNGAEISWFAPICNGDDEFLGDHNPNYKSSWENGSNIVLKADKVGFRNILCPSSYQVGQDTLTFASAIAPLTKQINLLPAIRCGEIHPPMLARSIATLDHILKGRLTLNIISSDLPGTVLSSEKRYRRSKEVIQILKQGWNNEFINFNDFKDVVDNNSYPIVDARDFYSYEEGFIGNAYNLDIDLIYESDEESIVNINNIIDNHGYRDNLINVVDSKFSIVDVKNDNQKIIVYCWSPTCDRAEELISILIDTSEYFGSFGKYFKKSDFSIYKGGWEEWDSILKQK